MITQELQHPDVIGWEVDEDLRRASMILTARSTATSPMPRERVGSFARREATIEYVPKKAIHRIAAEPYPSDSLTRSIEFDEPAASHALETESIDQNDYPTSPQGGWRPWVFATAGFIGGNIAMTMGGVSPNYLPTIIIAEIVLGIAICVAFYPRAHSREAIA